MSDTRVRAAIALGSNTHDRLGLLEGGRAAIGRLDGVQLLAATPIEETEPIGPPQPDFLNQMLLVETSLTLPALLDELQQIEVQHGRIRTAPKGPRTIDLDIVWADGVTITTDRLLVPHPGLTSRDFWQRELAVLLGGDAADAAIAAARIHAGLDTARPRA